jgi:hypothetical protein
LNGFISVRRVTGVMVDAVATTVFIALAKAFLSFLVREILRRVAGRDWPGRSTCRGGMVPRS